MKWNNISNNDFITKVDDYTLRVKQMDKKIWWWVVYYKAELITIHCYYYPRKKKKAKAFAEMVYRVHKSALNNK